ncbi:glucosylglycerol-phosphate synthase [Tranquillimonas alkanivorans]|uniref:Glucosyl-glycerol phosphate synthase n=1 Tax=Tranquillimonas alkanivorans TaxID=441119 RepID=A0A1I5KGA8_9RHOB|nr:glucosylglycerol-phosphate synthase [Tranquillimonas alkanivorans]SFO84062.1 glucosyl-glycerol phosphate synthase [Tranquillimonas alkanivorans]
MPSELVIVYHRQPYEEVEEDGKIVFKENKSPNGIVPTLKGFFGRVEKGAWVAWKHADDPSNPDFERVVEIEDSYGKYSVSRLPLTPEQVKSFYHVTSKEAFWPILHSFKEKYNYDPVDWPTFREVNWAFAEAAAAEAAEGAVVWVHDYNLWLVPGYLRQLRPDVRISFFHHTPFPSADMFNVLPWRREIVGSLLACDVVGFHIPRYAANFLGVAESLFDVEAAPRTPVNPDFVGAGTALGEKRVAKSLTYEGRKVQIAVSPVGVDVDYIQSRAEQADTVSRAEAIRAGLGDCKMILSVGRTDYTKGGADQLMSFERLLEEHPELHRKVRLMHVSVSANRNMTVYEEIQNEIEQVAGRINGRFGTFEWQPVALISRAIPFDELVAYYRSADVAWITPLADGMNLVAKEFAACRTDGDGVLVLSEFAGAAIELTSAVLANPFSYKSMDRALIQAMDMEEDERRGRMEKMRETIRRYDIKSWAEDQMAGFAGVDRAAGDRSAA